MTELPGGVQAALEAFKRHRKEHGC